MARLDREARAAARLKHPGIITVHDRIAGPDGRPWIVMELVNGGSLADLIAARGPLVPEHAADIGRQVAAALDAARRMGITHRDIKPANILIEENRVVLTDFGIAAVEGDATLTATGAIRGTPAFMAPEQVPTRRPRRQSSPPVRTPPTTSGPAVYTDRRSGRSLALTSRRHASALALAELLATAGGKIGYRAARL
ncbi:serine/threonine-protein kinase [Streptomyces sp. NPDC016562]|uniref:serine/threonine-protein kinase n=1 Tax=Streptomyces sp. NPDC016562 TaxID=3364966 RepID=UPI0037024446